MRITFLQIPLIGSIVFNATFGGVNAQTTTPLFTTANWNVNTLTTSQFQKLNLLQSSSNYSNIIFVEVGDLESSQQNGWLMINIPGTTCTPILKAKQVESYSNGDYYWYGEYISDGGDTEEECYCYNGSLNIMKVNDNVFGNILIDETVYELHDIGGGKRVLAQRVYSENIGYCGHANPQAPGENTAGDQGVEMPVYASNRSESSCPVKLLALYTESARESVPNIANTINMVVNETNQAFRNSDVQIYDLEVVLVGIQEIDFDESNDIGADRDDLIADSDVQTLRNTNNADIVIIFVESDYGDVLGISGTLTLESERAYSLVRPTQTAHYVGSHEIGHLFGCRHQLVSDDFGPIEHAYQFLTGCWPFRNKKRTLMWSQASGKLVQHFSNPNVEYYFDGPVTGSTDANNAQNLKNNACTVANFRSDGAIPTLNASITGSTNACPCFNTLLAANIYGGVPGAHTISWRTSVDGFNWSAVQGTQTTFQVNVPCTEGDRIYVQLTVTSVDGQTDIAFFSVRSSTTWPGQEEPCQERNFNEHFSEDSKGFEIKAFPSPANDKINISGFLNEPGQYEIVFHDLYGKIVKIVSFYADKGEFSYQCEVQSFTLGHYVASLRTPMKTSQVRFLKMND
ncbi:MAG: zinc-dependent metalloprotease family protein [Saprospiraceae bacterium]|nr:zinc-dependent metalloprotease family protein [Saprospiraceae bacterium]